MWCFFNFPHSQLSFIKTKIKRAAHVVWYIFALNFQFNRIQPHRVTLTMSHDHRSDAFARNSEMFMLFWWSWMLELHRCQARVSWLLQNCHKRLCQEISLSDLVYEFRRLKDLYLVTHSLSKQAFDYEDCLLQEYQQWTFFLTLFLFQLLSELILSATVSWFLIIMLACLEDTDEWSWMLSYLLSCIASCLNHMLFYFS